jgi:KUP system potassium uptake protein
VLGVLGLSQLVQGPGVLAAASPAHAVQFFADNTTTGFLALGAVFLVVTGGEALYADLGHFGHRPIRLAWFAVVLPALLVHYYGQGSLLIRDPGAIDQPLFRMAPDWGLKPLVLLATVATVIASQALITGVFSLTMQAIQLGYAPRHRIRHTSAEAYGQVYVPVVNWVLMAACIGLVVGFGSSDALASAYGVAVTATMVITTILFYVVLRERFRWAKAPAVALCATFLVIDCAFLGANLFKIPTGGWFPLLAAGAMFTLMTTWHTGRRIVAERVHRDDRPLRDFVAEILTSDDPPRRVDGTAIYLFSTPDLAPPAMVANVRNNEVLHARVAVVTIETTLEPHVAPADRAVVTEVGDGVHKVVLRHGFLEQPDVPSDLREGDAAALDLDLDEAVYILGGEIIEVTERPGMRTWREKLFALINRNATPAGRYFNLPPDQTITISTLVEL